MTDNDVHTIHTFRKNSLEQVRASLTHYKGREYADLRVYYQGGDGDFHPSRKGLTLALERLGDLEEAVHKLRERIKGGRH